MKFLTRPFVGEMKFTQVLNASLAPRGRDRRFPVGQLAHDKTPSGMGVVGRVDPKPAADRRVPQYGQKR